MAYIPGTGARPKFTLVWVDREGRAEALPLPPAAYSYPRLSPNGGRLVTSIVEQEKGNDDIWVSDLSRNTRSRLTFDPRTDATPIWTPDGKRVTFASSHDRAPDLSWKLADGTGGKEYLCSMDNAQFPTCWSPDGGILLFTDEHPDTKFDMWMLSIDGGREPQSLLVTEFNETAGVFSPDGRWIAYQTDESGRYEVYVRPFRESGAKHLISTDGGTEPVWAPDGRELFYRNGDRMMAVSVQSTPEFIAEKPELLFEGRYAANRMGANYDITRDGRRFLMIKRGEAESGTLTELKVILNWSEEMKRYFPPGN